MSKENDKFPVLYSGRRPKKDGFPDYVKWSELSEEQAQKNHAQSLTRLAERGGLSPSEIVGNVEGIGWGELGGVTEEQRQTLLARIGV